jgi:hypothetical protein
MMIGASVQMLAKNLAQTSRETHTIQILAGNRPLIRREKDSNNPPVPENTNELKRLAPATETPLRLGEALRGADQPAETDQTVGCCAGDSGCRDKRSEGHAGGEDRASDQGGDAPDDDDGVSGLTAVYAGDPAGEGENAITGDSEDETRSGDDGDRSVLR